METAKLKKFAQAARTDLIRQVGAKLAPVSYTHLTLPTSDLV